MIALSYNSMYYYLPDQFLLSKSPALILILNHVRRVKKPAEFNRPRIPISERIITRRANSYISKKVGMHIYIYSKVLQ